MRLRWQQRLAAYARSVRQPHKMTLIAWIAISLVGILTPRQTKAQEAVRLFVDSAAVFQDRENTVQWILSYDRMAWLSTDLVVHEDSAVLANLGPEWFCFQYDDKWHAVYGEYDKTDDRYRIAVHYEVSENGAVVRTESPLDTNQIDVLASALSTARSVLPAEYGNAPVPLNQYVRRKQDGSLEVWFLPSWDPQRGLLVFGGEAQVILDDQGREPLEQMYRTPQWQGFAPDTTLRIDMDYRDESLPTVGAMFFLIMNRSQFSHIFIHTAQYSSTLVDTADGTGWVHSYVPDRAN